MNSTGPELTLAVHKLTYNLSMFMASEIKKDLKKRTGKNSYMKLDSDEPFDTWKAQLLAQIDQHLHPERIQLDDYDITFAIPHISPSPITIQSNEDYGLLVERTLKSKEFAANVKQVRNEGEPISCRHPQ